MDDLSRHLGISKKTLYKVYTTKDAIVTDFIKTLIAESRSELNHKVVNGQTEIMRLSIFNWFIVNQALTLGAVVLYDIRKYYPSAYQLLKQYKLELILILNALLVDGQNAGIFRSDIDTMLTAELRIDVLEWDIRDTTPAVRSIASKQKQFFDLFLRGLQQANQNTRSIARNM